MARAFRARLICASAFLALAGGGSACAENLADAIALAYQTNPTIAAERANLRFLEETYVQARAGYRPSVNAQSQLTYQYNGEIGATPDSETNSGNAFLTFSQPIYTGGRVTAAVRAAEADILAERETLRQSEADVLQQVITSYVNVRRDQQAIRIGQENVAVLTRQVQETRVRFEVGEVTKTDVAQSEAELAQAQASLATANAQLAIDRGSYAQVVGQSPGELEPEPSLKLPATLDEAFDRAQQYNPNIRQAEYGRQGAEARLAAAKAQGMPRVTINGQVGFATPFNQRAIPTEADNFQQQSIVQATVTQPLFAGGAISSGIRQAVERENFFTIQLEGARRNAVQGLSQAWNQLLSARANIAANEERVRAARVAVEGARAEQAVGLRTTLEVLTAEQESRDAELALVQARRDEYVATASVLNVTGQLAANNIVAALPLDPGGHSFTRLKKASGYVPWEEGVKALDGIAGAPDVKMLPPPPDEPLVTAAPGQGASTEATGPSGKAMTSAPTPPTPANLPPVPPQPPKR
jgi:outer membrane protein